MESLSYEFCSGLDAIGVGCAQELLTIRIWHLFVGLTVFIFVTMGVWLFRRPNRLDRHFKLHQSKTPYGASPERRTLRLHPHDFAKALGENGYDAIEQKTIVAEKLNEKYSARYFVVRFHEGGQTLFSQELKIIAWPYRLNPNEFQLDPATLSRLKTGSVSKLDDELDAKYGADGTFDIFFRKVRWWDLRHWLNHPAREIRYALYVAIFAAALEYSGDIIDLIRQLFRVPGS